MKHRPGSKAKLPLSGKPEPHWENCLMNFLAKFFFNESGATAVEYAIMLLSIAIAIFSGVYIFGNAVKSLFDQAVDRYPSA
jgi:Flp pilus assembly pilin Flp